VTLLECIQRRAKKLVKELEGMSCKEWLRTLGLSNLEKRKLRSDLIALYSFLRRRSGEGAADLFSMGSSDRTRIFLSPFGMAEQPMQLSLMPGLNLHSCAYEEYFKPLS